MGKCIDMTGQKFGRLTVICRTENYITPKGTKFSQWICKCECGNTCIARVNDLKFGRIKSCGCLHKELAKQRRTKHSLSGTKLYMIWKSMKQRCSNQNNKDYPNYGERGIKVCDEWSRDFQAFYDWSTQNGYIEGLSIDRIDTNGNYEPVNCRWITIKQQANNLRKNINITFNGTTHTLSEWSDITGIKYKTLMQRYVNGWSPDRMLTEPVRK